ncbi:MAG: sensor histidine kinase [Mucilaginibacter polytrichastri]|nr:sensor histidine kinase [Mucilaginibacter polytrichastri]
MGASEKEIYHALLIAACIIGVILIYFIASVIWHQRRNRKLYQEKINAEISTMEKERKRIASDLHDEIGPLLSTIKFQIGHLNVQDEDDEILVGKSGEYIDTIITRLREISYDLLPQILHVKGLIPAIQNFIDGIKRGDELTIDFHHRLEKRLPSNIELNLYRIVQEIVHNTIKHAKASQLVIELAAENGMIRLLTHDNGVGFSFDENNNTGRGLGLLNLQSRTDLMSGEFNIKSSPGNGSHYLIEIPLNEPA